MDDYFILSCDGGGVRGLITATFLGRMEEDFKIDWCRDFDMFAGSSIGALNVCCLMSSKCATEHYTMKNFNKIMDKSCMDRVLNLVQPWPKYDGKGKTEMLKDIFGKFDINECGKDIVIPVYDISKRRAKVFTKYSDNVKIWQIIDASSAAPAYYPPVKINDSWYIDGGIIANNPSVIAIAKAKKYMRIRSEDRNIKLLSIGTGNRTVSIDGEKAQQFGGIEWISHDLLGITMDETLVNEQAQLLLNDGCYLRIDSQLTNVDDALDNTTPKNRENMIKLGNKWYDDNKEKLEKFLNKKIDN